MTNRTVQIQGYGYGSTPAEINVTLDGNTVFSGTVPTLNEPPPSTSGVIPTVTICTFEIPVELQGDIPMTCTVTNGTVLFAEMLANYVKEPNPVYTLAEFNTLISPTSTPAERFEIHSLRASPPFGPEDVALWDSPTATPAEKQAMLSAHGASVFVSSGVNTYQDLNGTPDIRLNVTVDGIVRTPTHSGELTGTWWWLVDNGSTLAYDFNVIAGLE